MKDEKENAWEQIISRTQGQQRIVDASPAAVANRKAQFSTGRVINSQHEFYKSKDFMDQEDKRSRPHIKQDKILHKNRSKQMEQVMGV